MLNAEFGRAEKQTPLCYCLICTKIRRGNRGVERRNQTATCALCIRRGRRNWKNEAHGTWANAATTDAWRPSRVSTSRQRVCLSSPFVLSHSNERSNQTARAPMSSPTLGACKQNHPLKGESISPRAKRRERAAFVSTGDWTWRSSSIINIWMMLQWRIDGAQEWRRAARKMVIDLTNFARSVDVRRCFARGIIYGLISGSSVITLNHAIDLAIGN